MAFKTVSLNAIVTALDKGSKRDVAYRFSNGRTFYDREDKGSIYRYFEDGADNFLQDGNNNYFVDGTTSDVNLYRYFEDGEGNFMQDGINNYFIDGAI